MSVRQTSIESYDELKPKLSSRHRMVMLALNLLVEASDFEIAAFLNEKDPNFVRPRRNELYKMGKIKCVGKRKCTITKKTVMIWSKK